eukprot:507254-Karenia_brevis.AAC.1
MFEAGWRWWASLGVGGLLALGWHCEDQVWDSGHFVPVCELVSLGLGGLMGSGNGWKASWFGVLGMYHAPFGKGGAGRGRALSEGPSPGRVSRNVGVIEAGGSSVQVGFRRAGVLQNGENFARHGGNDVVMEGVGGSARSGRGEVQGDGSDGLPGLSINMGDDVTPPPPRRDRDG